MTRITFAQIRSEKIKLRIGMMEMLTVSFATLGLKLTDAGMKKGEVDALDLDSRRIMMANILLDLAFPDSMFT